MQVNVSKYILFIGSLLLLNISWAGDELRLSDFSIYADKAVATNRHWSIPEDEVKKGELGLDMVIRYHKFYSRTNFNSFYTDRQFRYISLDTEAGMSYHKFDFYLRHVSEHALDREFDYGSKYPNQNSIGMRLNLVREGK